MVAVPCFSDGAVGIEGQSVGQLRAAGLCIAGFLFVRNKNRCDVVFNESSDSVRPC